ncbi:hypothetical protein [Actinacidiphila oryziradicis]|uniref:hypothetical protein n=1 Tax=Actinacidiphila oryziradicis TaxID=2571141 RepID=UPI003899255F
MAGAHLRGRRDDRRGTGGLSSVPRVDQYLLPLVAVAVALSFLPIAVELRRGRQARSRKGDRQP